MLSWCRRRLDDACAMWHLLRLLASVRFRLGGAYLRWRRETAFGHDPARWPTRAERQRAILSYGAWVGRMKRLRRG